MKLHYTIGNKETDSIKRYTKLYVRHVCTVHHLARLDSQKHCQKSTEKAERELRKEREKKVWFGIFAWIAIDTICPETFLPGIFQGTVDIIT